jgi:hypothetical protein
VRGGRREPAGERFAGAEYGDEAVRAIIRRRGPSAIIPSEHHQYKVLPVVAAAICLAAGLLATRSLLSAPDVWGLCLMAAGTLLLWWLAARCGEAEDRPFLQRVMLGAMGLRCVWAFVQHKLISTHYYTLIFAADAAGNHRWSAEHAQMWREGLWRPWVPTSLGEWHSWAVTFKTVLLYRLLGPSPFIPEALTITAGASAALAIYLTCRRIGGTRPAARTAAALTAFLPSLMFWSTQDLKDPILSCCAAWGLFAFVQTRSLGLRASSLLLLGLADLTALLYRAYAGLLLITGQGMAAAYAVRLPATAGGKLARAWIFITLAPVVMYFSYREIQSNYQEKSSLPWLVDVSDQYWEVARDSGVQGSLRPMTAPGFTTTPATTCVPAPTWADRAITAEG